MYLGKTLSGKISSYEVKVVKEPFIISFVDCCTFHLYGRVPLQCNSYAPQGHNVYTHTRNARNRFTLHSRYHVCYEGHDPEQQLLSYSGPPHLSVAYS